MAFARSLGARLSFHASSTHPCTTELSTPVPDLGHPDDFSQYLFKGFWCPSLFALHKAASSWVRAAVGGQGGATTS